jgi:hypothetical protein
MDRLIETIKKLTELSTQLGELLIKIISFLGWILILIDLFIK